MRRAAVRRHDRLAQHEFLSHVLRNFIEECYATAECSASGRKFLSHVLRNFIEERAQCADANKLKFLSHVLRNFIEDGR